MNHCCESLEKKIGKKFLQSQGEIVPDLPLLSPSLDVKNFQNVLALY